VEGGLKPYAKQAHAVFGFVRDPTEQERAAVGEREKRELMRSAESRPSNKQ